MSHKIFGKQTAFKMEKLLDPKCAVSRIWSRSWTKGPRVFIGFGLMIPAPLPSTSSVLICHCFPLVQDCREGQTDKADGRLIRQ